MKTYSAASDDLAGHISRMQSQFHPEIEGVTVGALFVFDEESGEPVLKHQGYGAAAVVSITPAKQRALGITDALIIVDRSHWLTLSAAQRDALIDHELEHLDRVISEETKEEPAAPQFDSLGRPKLKMRMHDHQLGWFDDVARRHGEASPEMRQAKALVAQTAQLCFDFGQLVAARSAGAGETKPKKGNGRQPAAH